MPEISDEKLARYKEAVDVLEDYDGGCSDEWRTRRLNALKPTPLVSDEELRKAYDEAYQGHNFTDALHAIGALYLRKAADKQFEEGYRSSPPGLRKWADEQTS